MFKNLFASLYFWFICSISNTLIFVQLSKNVLQFRINPALYLVSFLKITINYSIQPTTSKMLTSMHTRFHWWFALRWTVIWVGCKVCDCEFTVNLCPCALWRYTYSQFWSSLRFASTLNGTFRWVNLIKWMRNRVEFKIGLQSKMRGVLCLKQGPVIFVNS